MPWQAKSAKSAQMQMKIYSTFATCQYAHTHTHTEIGQYAKCRYV